MLQADVLRPDAMPIRLEQRLFLLISGTGNDIEKGREGNMGGLPWRLSILGKEDQGLKA